MASPRVRRLRKAARVAPAAPAQVPAPQPVAEPVAEPVIEEEVCEEEPCETDQKLLKRLPRSLLRKPKSKCSIN
jgi:hypothetical protein